MAWLSGQLTCSKGKLYGYANYIHLIKMIPAGVRYFLGGHGL